MAGSDALSADKLMRDPEIYVGSDCSEDDNLLLQEKGADKARSEALLHAFVNSLCLMMGVGVLGLPSVMAKAGWIMLAVLPVLVVMACYGGRLLTNLLYVDVPHGGERLEGYPEVGWRVMGWCGWAASQLSVKLVLLPATGTFAHLGSQLAKTAIIDMYYGHAGAPPNLDQDVLQKQALMMFCGAALLPAVFLPTLKEVAPLSIFGAFAIAAASVVVVVVGFADGAPHGEHALFRPSFGDGFGTIVLGLGGASSMPSIERQMSGAFLGSPSPRPYSRVLVWVFMCIAVAYLPVAFTGYYVYGEGVAGLVLDSLPRHGAYLAVLSVLNMSIAVHCFVTMQVLIFVLNEEFERKVFGVDQRVLSFRDHMCTANPLVRFLVRALLVLWAFTVAYSVPNFMALCDLTGSFCAFCVYILPCFFTLVLDRQRPEGEAGLGWPRRIWITFILAVSLAGFYFGFKAALKEVHDAFTS